MSTNSTSTSVSTNSTQVRQTASTRYSPLLHDGDSFRLLRVLPSLRQDSPLQCELYTASISRKQNQYIAGSYVWGPPEPKRSILLDGEPFQVRDNLFRFLKAFRSRSQPQVIWLDAICINQDDIQERSHQVQEMKRIYSGAKCVYSWLGYDKSLPRTGIFGRWYITDLYHWRPRYEPFHTRQRDQLEYILQAEYWSRMWIVQEFILAKEVYLLVGRNRLPYCKLHKLCGYRYQFESTVILQSKIYALMSYRMRTSTFEELFENSGELPRSVPLDGVFALLGLLGNSEEELRLISITDYNLTAWQLLQQILALKIIKSGPFAFAEQYNRYVIKGQRDDYMGGCVSLELNGNQSWQICGADDSRYSHAEGSSLQMAVAIRASRDIGHRANDAVEIAVYTPRWRTVAVRSGISVELSMGILPPESRNPWSSGRPLRTYALVEACDSQCTTSCVTHAVVGFSWQICYSPELSRRPDPTTMIDVPLLVFYASSNVPQFIHNVQKRSMEMVEAISSKVRMTAGRPYRFANSVIPYEMETDVETMVILSTFIRDLDAHNGWKELLKLGMDWTQKLGAKEYAEDIRRRARRMIDEEASKSYARKMYNAA